MAKPTLRAGIVRGRTLEGEAVATVNGAKAS